MQVKELIQALQGCNQDVEVEVVEPNCFGDVCARENTMLRMHKDIVLIFSDTWREEMIEGVESETIPPHYYYDEELHFLTYEELKKNAGRE